MTGLAFLGADVMVFLTPCFTISPLEAMTASCSLPIMKFSMAMAMEGADWVGAAMVSLMPASFSAAWVEVPKAAIRISWSLMLGKLLIRLLTPMGEKRAMASYSLRLNLVRSLGAEVYIGALVYLNFALSRALVYSVCFSSEQGKRNFSSRCFPITSSKSEKYWLPKKTLRLRYWM